MVPRTSLGCVCFSGLGMDLFSLISWLVAHASRYQRKSSRPMRVTRPRPRAQREDSSTTLPSPSCRLCSLALRPKNRASRSRYRSMATNRVPGAPSVSNRHSGAPSPTSGNTRATDQNSARPVVVLAAEASSSSFEAPSRCHCCSFSRPKSGFCEVV